MLRPVTKRPLFLHVGTSKSGTSALQVGLWDSVDILNASGLGLPLVGRGEAVRQMLRPLGWTPHAGFVEELDPESLKTLGTRLRDTLGDRLVISNEDLAEAPPGPIAAFREMVEAADLDLHVIVTARDWAKQLASDWQQLLKHRITTDYETFLHQVRDHQGSEGETFWRRQDFFGVCDRWGAGLDPSHVHLVPVPAAAVDKDAIFRVFADLLDFDPSTLRIDPEREINTSFGYVEAEMLRRVNLALGDRLPDYEKEYMLAVRRILVRRAIPRGQPPRITLPPAHVAWVREIAEERIAAVHERGFTVHGDQTLLLPDPRVVAPLPELDEAAMASAAIETLANFAYAEFQDRRGKRRKQRVPSLRATSPAHQDLPEVPPAEAPPAPQRASLARRIIRRLRP